MMSSNAFKPGEMVRHRDGRLMTVERLSNDSKWRCVWFQDRELKADDFAATEISLVASQDDPFDIGDTARLRSGGTVVTVVEKLDNGRCRCSWRGLDEFREESGEFTERTLELVKAAKVRFRSSATQ